MGDTRNLRLTWFVFYVFTDKHLIFLNFVPV